MKKSITMILTVILALVFGLTVLTACDNKTLLNQLISDYGITVEGGGFEKGSSLVADLIETTGEKGQEIVALLEEQNYDKDGEVSIYDIFVAKDGKEVQPNGKVKVTLTAPFESENGYVTFHVKDDNSVETLKTTYADGKISFETDGFSYFVITGAPEEAKRYALEVVMSDYLKITDKGTKTEITGDSVASVLLAEGESVTLTATSKGSDYICIGWYKIDYSAEDDQPIYTQLSATNEFTYTMETDTISVYPMAKGKLSGLSIYFENIELEPANMLFEGEGDASLLDNVPVFGCAAGKWIQLKENFDYTVDLGGLDFSKAGSYTVTYKYKWEEGFEDTINFMIEPRQYLFTAGVYGGAGGKITLGTFELPDDYTTETTKGQELLLSAVADEGYNFLGWYEPVDVKSETVVLKDTPVCADAEYRYITGEVDYAVYAVFEEITTYFLTVGQQGAGGCVSINGDTASSLESSPYYENYEAGANITLVAQTRSTEYTFLGWFEPDEAQATHLVLKDTPVCTELTYAFEMPENGYTVYAVFDAIILYLWSDSANAGFNDTEKSATVTVGDAVLPNPEAVLIYGGTLEGDVSLTKDADYTIDLGGLDFAQAGIYTITYRYIKDTSKSTSLTVTVMAAEEPVTINLTYEGTADPVKYNGGRAAYVFKTSILNNGVACDIEALGLSYEWRDHTTKAVVAAARDDTWDATSEHYPSPAVPGTYDFVVYSEVEGVKTDLLTVTRTIVENQFALVSDISTLSEYVCYTFIAKVGSDYYAMSNPFDGKSEREAIKVTPDENGVISLGTNYEYVFRPYDSGKTSGDLVCYGCRTGWGLNRTGKLILWGTGGIEYTTSTSADYTVTITINADGTVTFHAPFCAGTLRLVYDETTGKYLFTAKKADDDTRTSYSVYLYSEYTEPIEETKEVYEFSGNLSKEYDGEAVSFNVYKEVYICTENGEDALAVLKNGTGRFVWTDLKGNVISVGTPDENGTVTGPSEIGSYCLVFQTMQKGENGMEWAEKAVLHTFEITDPNEVN